MVNTLDNLINRALKHKQAYALRATVPKRVSKTYCGNFGALNVRFQKIRDWAAYMLAKGD